MDTATASPPRHRCSAVACDELVESRHLFCGPHWALVPRQLRTELRQTFRFGQEHGKVRPSASWVDAADRAIAAVAELEDAA